MTDNDKRQQIIEGALEVFSNHGFHKASIKMIAKAAGIKSSALIYHYFADKKALLEAIMREQTPIGNLPLLDESLRGKMMDLPPEIVLPQVLHGVLSVQDNPKIMRLIVVFITEAARMPEVADTAYDTQRMMLGFAVYYLQHQVKLGRLKPHNSEMVARIIISTMLLNVLAHGVFPKLADGFGERDAYVEQVVDVLLNGLRSEA
jgi:AcrR family transcriptional regulator